jgi:hypothetical protein
VTVLAAAVLPVLLAGGQQPADPAFSPTEAQSLVEKLNAIERRSKLGRPPRQDPVVVSEAELNSYLNLSLGPKMPKGLSAVVVRFDRDRLMARGLLDLNQVQGQLPTPGGLGPMLGLLSGRVPVDASGRLQSAAEGFGAFEVEAVHLSSFPVPLSVLEQLVVSATKSAENPQGFDIHSPFRLPYAMKRVRLQPGRALLEF